MVAITTTPRDLPTRFPSRPVLVVLPPVTRPGARVYRRRRLAVLAAALGLVLVGVLAFSQLTASSSGTAGEVKMAPASAPIVHNPAAYGASGQRVPARAVYVVQPGDTLWSIARAIDPAGDTRATVDRLVALNGGAALEPGQRLRLTGND
jgi:nucleoid-associated protein YgaU